MSPTLVLPGPLRELAGGRAVIELDGSPATVADALAALRAAFPAVHDRVVTEQGELRPHINLFVGREDVRHTGGLETPLPPGSEVFILPSVSGGRRGSDRRPEGRGPERPEGRRPDGRPPGPRPPPGGDRAVERRPRA